MKHQSWEYLQLMVEIGSIKRINLKSIKNVDIENFKIQTIDNFLQILVSKKIKTFGKGDMIKNL